MGQWQYLYKLSLGYNKQYLNKNDEPGAALEPQQNCATLLKPKEPSSNLSLQRRLYSWTIAKMGLARMVHSSIV